MEFWVNLIQIEKHQTIEAASSLKANCTHVVNEIYLFEGEPEFLEAEFKVLAQGVIPCVGDFSQNELIKLCKEQFHFDYKLLEKYR